MTPTQEPTRTLVNPKTESFLPEHSPDGKGLYCLQSEPVPYAIEFSTGASRIHGTGRPAFILRVKSHAELDRILRADPYSVAVDFIRGRFGLEGDLVAAVHFKWGHPRQGWRYWLRAVLAHIAARFQYLSQTRSLAARNIRFHYDRSNDFYRQFLDSRMVYSCAYFQNPDQSLEDAQLSKLDHICRKLDLKPAERFLDIGCGWGGLIVHASRSYGASATGCTLSHEQFKYASQLIIDRNLRDRAMIHEADYREEQGPFHKIASVGMFEHVGRRRLPEYFRTIHRLLESDGLFLNHGIIRPQNITDGPETLFLRNHVFPGGELCHLSDVIRTAERAGFEVLDVENLRPHYALTCRAWVKRLQENFAACLQACDVGTYRTWLLYLAASAFSFESARTDVYQILMAKRTSQVRRLTRNYIYAQGRWGNESRLDGATYA